MRTEIYADSAQILLGKVKVPFDTRHVIEAGYYSREDHDSLRRFDALVLAINKKILPPNLSTAVGFWGEEVVFTNGANPPLIYSKMPSANIPEFFKFFRIYCKENSQMINPLIQAINKAITEQHLAGIRTRCYPYTAGRPIDASGTICAASGLELSLNSDYVLKVLF